ncbi:MAG: leucyl/phenylalanyl-tRNA--protein transferase [Burkholderiales bacterium]
MIPILRQSDTRFPPAENALCEPNGLLAMGGDLSPERILSAYRQGIFPWFSPGDPILWWSPDPRMVLYPSEFKVSRSLAKNLRNRSFEVRFDTVFGEVIDACAAPRGEQPGTWITPAMRAAYMELHRLGYAHSVETWMDGSLAGGLYGVALGNMFFGESMFTRIRDASKIALATMIERFLRDDVALIDCQFHTEHLQSLGARAVSRAEFLRQVRELVHNSSSLETWTNNHVRHY